MSKNARKFAPSEVYISEIGACEMHETWEVVIPSRGLWPRPLIHSRQVLALF